MNTLARQSEVLREELRDKPITFLEQSLEWQTKSRGSDSDEYQIYLSCAEQLGWKLKTYEEWLGK